MGDSYRFKIGDIDCLVVNDGEMIGNADLLFANAPEDELQQALQRYDLEADHLPSTWSCLLVKTATNVVLVDTGFGGDGAYGGRLLPTLHAEGIRPEDVDTVILTHAHGDHIGGVVDGNGKATFPDATHFMGRDEWHFWTNEENLKNVPEWAAETARRKLPPLADHIQLIDHGSEIVPGIRVIAAPGHTAGHIALEVESRGEFLLHMVDVALHQIQVEYPEWVSRLDQDPDQTVETRQAIYSRAAEKNALTLAFHFSPFPSLGHISRQDDRWRWRPVQP